MFQAGDRVVCINTYFGGVIRGEHGTVIHYAPSSSGNVGVKWDMYREQRHNLDGSVERGHGWYLPERCIELLPAEDYGEISAQNYNAIKDLIF